MKKRIVGMLLVLLMVMSLAPMSALADKSDTDIAYAVEGGNIYFDKATGTITDCDYRVTEAIIPAEIEGVAVTSIGAGAFDSCDSLTSVTIPASVTSIGNFAFRYCTSVPSIDVPDSVTSIGDGVFDGCTSLASVTIPDGVTNIGWCAFSSTSIVSINIPDSVTSISDYAFDCCTSLASIEIPDSVTSIGVGAFNSCRSLMSIDVAEDNSNYSSKDGVLFNKDKTELIRYPERKTGTEYTVPDSVTSIGAYAFSGTSLVNINIPDSVTNVYSDAFERCTSLTSINVSEGNSTYSSDGGVLFDKYKTEIIRYPVGKTNAKYAIPVGVTSIGDWAFSGCTSLASIEIPVGVTSIGAGAFDSCGSLTSVEIPAGVTSIGDNAFLDCTSLENVTMGDVTNINESTFQSRKSLASMKITNSVTSIGNYAFSNCTNLKSVTMASVTSIGDGAFSGCTSLASIEIPDGVTSIGAAAFEGSGLTSVTIPGSVTNIGEGAFNGCDSLKDVYYSGTEEQWEQMGIGGDNNPLPGNATIHFAESVPGDVTGDGEVNVMDLIRLKKCIADGSTEEMKNMDINGDGKVDVLDLIRLKKIIAGA